MRVDVGGLSIAFEIAGAGPAVLLTHGFVGDGPATWGSQVEALSDEFTVIAWDAPGAGGSADPPEDFGMDDDADCLAGFLTALRIERAHLVGLSFGAALVLAAFHRHRQVAASLALVSGYAGWTGSLGPEEADLRLARSLEASQLAPAELVAAMAPSLFSPSAEGEHVDVPVLLLFSDHDLRAPVRVGEALADAMPTSELVVLRGPGHASPVEAPDAVTRELRRFLRAAGRSHA
ncbi:alpha/beta fold hydrolase [Cellulosimicrobium terreum]|nr:alpha/beta fold hydrolase [Cellulosimicrobium terreum]